jgi:hypothetical protein
MKPSVTFCKVRHSALCDSLLLRAVRLSQHTHTHTHARTRTHIHARAHTHTRARTHTHAHTHTHTQTHTHYDYHKHNKLLRLYTVHEELYLWVRNSLYTFNSEKYQYSKG